MRCMNALTRSFNVEEIINAKKECLNSFAMILNTVLKNGGLETYQDVSWKGEYTNLLIEVK